MGRGRPTLTGQRGIGESPRVMASLPHRDMAVLRSGAEARGLTLSAYARQLLLDGIYPDGKPTAPETVEAQAS